MDDYRGTPADGFYYKMIIGDSEKIYRWKSDIVSDILIFNLEEYRIYQCFCYGREENIYDITEEIKHCCNYERKRRIEEAKKTIIKLKKKSKVNFGDLI